MTTHSIFRKNLCVLIFFLTCLILTGCSIFSGNRYIPISDGAKHKLIATFNNTNFNVPLVYENSEEVLTFVAAFDGTMNDKSHTPIGEKNTVIAKLYDDVDAPEFKSGEIENSRIAKDYEKGPGCLSGLLCWFDAVTGNSSEAKALEMLKYVSEYVNSQPQPHRELRIVTLGFSRGAAAARHFLNLVYKAEQEGRFTKVDEVWADAILFDTVATGQQNKLNLSFPPNVEFAVHFVAINEARKLFSPTIDNDSEFESLAARNGVFKNRIWTEYIPGAHSDIGDSYLEGAGPLLTNISQSMMHLMGISRAKLSDCERHINCPDLNQGLHDSRGIYDLLTFTPSGFSCNFNRNSLAKEAITTIDNDQVMSLLEHINKNSLSQKLTEISFGSNQMYVLDADLRKLSWPIYSPNTYDFRDDKTTIHYGRNMTTITLHGKNNDGNHYDIPTEVIKELKRKGNKGKVEFNFIHVNNGNLWWFVDDCLPNEH